MREILIDEAGFTRADDVHAFLARELDFPPYYGANLDALNDCLDETSEPTTVSVFMSSGPAQFVAGTAAAEADPADPTDSVATTAPAAPADPTDPTDPSDPTDQAAAFAQWFPKLVRSLLRAACNNDALDVLVHASSMEALARLAACPGMTALLDDDAFVVQGIIASITGEQV